MRSMCGLLIGTLGVLFNNAAFAETPACPEIDGPCFKDQAAFVLVPQNVGKERGEWLAFNSRFLGGKDNFIVAIYPELYPLSWSDDHKKVFGRYHDQQIEFGEKRGDIQYTLDLESRGLFTMIPIDLNSNNIKLINSKGFTKNRGANGEPAFPPFFMERTLQIQVGSDKPVIRQDGVYPASVTTD